MTLLCVDTSGAQGSLALVQPGADPHQVTWVKKAMHSEVATVELQRLLHEAGSDLRQLTHLAVNVGPGSFTGLRVGINLVKSLAFALTLPVTLVNSLECLSFLNTAPGDKIFIAVKSIQDFFFAASFTRSETEIRPGLAPFSTTRPELGGLAQGCTKVLIDGQSAGFSTQTEAKDLARLILWSRPSRAFSPWKSVEPLYIRASEAEEKLKKRLLKPV